jgi:hypothetical protein
MERFAPILRGISEKVGLKSIKDLMKQPGTKAIYRITIHHQDYRAVDCVATLTRSIGRDIPLEVIYQNRFENKPLTRKLLEKAYDGFITDLTSLRFDKLKDQNIAPFSKDLCMVERGSGGFVHSVIFAPSEAKDGYEQLYKTIKTYLPEALREIK